MKYTVLGFGLLAVCVAGFAAGYGSRWEFGRYGMPRSILTAEGLHPDGTEPDPINAALVRADVQEEALLAMLGVLVVGGAYAVYQTRTTKKLEAELRRLKREVLGAEQE